MKIGDNIRLSRAGIMRSLMYGGFASGRIFENNLLNGKPNTKFQGVSGSDNIKRSCNGFAGEFAFCEMAGIPIDDTVKDNYPRAVLGTDPGDVTYQDVRLDVKPTRYPFGKLICKTYKHRSDCPSSMVIDRDWETSPGSVPKTALG